jgi:hypothetical protein
MISCKRATELISLSLETRLGWRQRLALRFHLGICSLCRRFRQQSRLLQQAGRDSDEALNQADAGATLPESARERIKQALRERSASGPDAD